MERLANQIRKPQQEDYKQSPKHVLHLSMYIELFLHLDKTLRSPGSRSWCFSMLANVKEQLANMNENESTKAAASY